VIGPHGSGGADDHLARPPAPEYNAICSLADAAIVSATPDRPLWAHGYADPEGVYGIWIISWNPAGTALAFVSTHENWCSLYGSDVVTIGSNGAGCRRITQAPGCAALANFPKGTV
jgi:hypothetical protein